MIRSTPSRSGSGNMTPASTTTVVSPQVSASMFIPNSPTPPSATTSSISEASRTTVDRDTPGGGSFGSKGAASCGSVRLLGAPETKWGGLNDLRRNYSTAPRNGTRGRCLARVRRASDTTNGKRRVSALQRGGEAREFGDGQGLRPPAAVEARRCEDLGCRRACQRLVRQEGVRERLPAPREDGLHDGDEDVRVADGRIRRVEPEPHERRQNLRRRAEGARRQFQQQFDVGDVLHQHAQ